MSGRGGAFLLKLGTGDPVVYATIAGLKVEHLSICGQPFEAARRLDQKAWRELLSGAGERSVSVSATGIFTGSTAEAQAKRLALAGEVAQFELSFEAGDKMQGRFLISRLDYTGDYNGERNYRIALESSGEVVAA
jgi:predicted secreted protein